MLRHGSLRFFRLLIGHCREDLKVLVVAVIEHDQELIIPLDAGLIDLLNGLQAGEQDRVMRRAGKIIMERAVVFKNGQDITGLDGSFQLAEDALQNGQFTVGALLRGQIGDPALDIFAGRVDRLDIDLIKIDKLQHGLHKKAKIHGFDKRAFPLLDLHQAHHAELFQRFPHRNAADREHFTKRRFRRKLISGAIFSGNDLRLQFLRDIIAFGKLSAFNLLVQSGFLSRGKPLRR